MREFKVVVLGSGGVGKLKSMHDWLDQLSSNDDPFL